MNYKYVHTSFSFLKSIATNDVLPNILDACPFPVCGACIYWKATKRHRRNKTAWSINEYKPVASVVDYVSVSVLISITIGCIVQMSGFLSFQCYRYNFFLPNIWQELTIFIKATKYFLREKVLVLDSFRIIALWCRYWYIGGYESLYTNVLEKLVTGGLSGTSAILRVYHFLQH